MKRPVLQGVFVPESSAVIAKRVFAEYNYGIKIRLNP